MPKCPNCKANNLDSDLFLLWDPYGKRPPRWICFRCGFIGSDPAVLEQTPPKMTPPDTIQPPPGRDEY